MEETKIQASEEDQTLVENIKATDETLKESLDDNIDQTIEKTNYDIIDNI